jgi:hypothetical protein
MGISKKKVSIISMISLTIFLTFMDVKDLYYKITMCGPEPSWSFTADFYEVRSYADTVQIQKANNGTWTWDTNMWNALAMQCESLEPFKITTKPASISSFGTGCVLGGVKRTETLVFAGCIRIDSLIWGAGLLADIIHEPFPIRPYTSTVYALTHNLPELSYRASMAAMIAKEDIPTINETMRSVFDAFGTRIDLWGEALCYEIVPVPEFGHRVERAIPQEYGCIWSDPTGENLHTFHIDKVSGKYFRALSEWVGWGWLTLDSLRVSTVYLRARLRTKSKYRVTNTEEDGLTFSHLLELDMGLDGVLYYVMLMMEVLMILINSLDAWVVALLVVRPLLPVVKRGKLSYSSSVGSTKSLLVKSTASAKSVNMKSATSTKELTGTIEDASGTKVKKDEALSRVLLYTDLTCVAFRKQLLAVLLVIDAIFSWLYIMPNSTLYSWSTSIYQIGSAYLSNFRVWTVVLVLIDFGWRWTFVLVNERFAALITELTYISSFEIMLCTLVAVYTGYQSLLDICITKWAAGRQRQLLPMAPGVASLYNAFSMYTYGEESNEGYGAHVLYDPLFTIIGNAILFSIGVVMLRLIVNASTKAFRGTLGKDVETFWRTYQRNSVEVFMNDPLRAKALVRSQSIMSYRFGRSVFIRPFVYLEQNYYIYRGKFRRRPLFPIFDNSEAVNGAEVNVSGYQLEGVYHDEESKKMRKKREAFDTQIPLC